MDLEDNLETNWRRWRKRTYNSESFPQGSIPEMKEHLHLVDQKEARKYLDTVIQY